ncbi:MAG: hypothetical protein ACQZ3N_03835, partial [cyanobacterium endosymbiont of Rhopalodia yunnanensis]
ATGNTVKVLGISLIGKFYCVTCCSKVEVEYKEIKVICLIKLVGLALQVAYFVRHFYEGYAINLPLEDFLEENKFLVFELFREFLLPNHNE